jgi:hypothetical protein
MEKTMKSFGWTSVLMITLILGACGDGNGPQGSVIGADALGDGAGGDGVTDSGDAADVDLDVEPSDVDADPDAQNGPDADVGEGSADALDADDAPEPEDGSDAEDVADAVDPDAEATDGSGDVDIDADDTADDATDTDVEPGPVDCVVSDWTEWTACGPEDSCGTGERSRTRAIQTPASGGGRECGALEESEPCALAPCPVDCELGEWTEFGACDVTCGEGLQTRTRAVLVEPANGGAPCGATSEDRLCALDPCDGDCEVSEWTDWSACSEECGVGTQTRTREVVVEPIGAGAACPALTDSRECTDGPCPVDCELSDWSEWGECDAPCDGGEQVRTREVVVEPVAAGAPCGERTERRPCNTQICVVLDCDPAQPCCTVEGNFAPSTQVCRTSRGQCDTLDRCTGHSGACPPDRTLAQGTSCFRFLGGFSGYSGLCLDGVCYSEAAACELSGFFSFDSAPCNVRSECGRGYSCTPDIGEACVRDLDPYSSGSDGLLCTPADGTANSGLCVDEVCTPRTSLTRYAWHEGPWSTCSAGTQTRTVECRDETWTGVADGLCPSPKPATARSCRN